MRRKDRQRIGLFVLGLGLGALGVAYPFAALAIGLTLFVLWILPYPNQ